MLFGLYTLISAGGLIPGKWVDGFCSVVSEVDFGLIYKFIILYLVKLIYFPLYFMILVLGNWVVICILYNKIKSGYSSLNCILFNNSIARDLFRGSLLFPQFGEYVQAGHPLRLWHWHCSRCFLVLVASSLNR